LFDGFAELDVALCHAGRALAVLKEGQHPVEPSGTLFGVAPFGALRSGALPSTVDQLSGNIGFGGKNRKEAVAVDVDE